MKNKLMAILLSGAMALGLASCGNAAAPAEGTEAQSEEAAEEAAEAPEEAAEEAAKDEGEAEETAAAEEPEVEKNGETYILCTSDVHCGVDQGFGYAGLSQIKNTLEAQGYEVILIDDGDSIQGEALGAFTEGEAIIKLMNDMDYDIAIPGNHEFDYGVDRFLELTKMAEFPYISCNFNHNGELVFEPYTIEEVNGVNIGFVGITTPETIMSSTPAYFMDESGEYVYGFMGEETGEELYTAVQEAVDAARDAGADYVYAMAHLGNEAKCEPWTYADVISHTSGIDVFFDGHSHDTDIITMENKDGEEVTRIAVGTKLSGVGYSLINADGEIDDSGSWIWINDASVPELLAIDNDMKESVDSAKAEYDKILEEVIAKSDVDLIIHDPVEKKDNGDPIRMVRRAETNLGDLVADAYRDQMGADVAIANGGSIRVNIDKGDVTYGNILKVHPYGNMLSVVEVSGQDILDALEWGAAEVPEENGGFLQVSGMSYEVDSSIDSTCTTDDDGMFTGVSGARRVKNVMIGEEPIDPSKTYTLACNNYLLFEQGDGFTMFKESKVIEDSTRLDNQVIIDYIKDTLGGTIGEEYADPYGQGRIVVK
ncbi:MAG: bifunctional metallophosphatase/5'-nucleotidase [Lachnospiraceae bacterium]|nr:bifunctional metallophosphatase/5'-nucleotidase [Lachnospiraceae bacterium]